MRVVVTRPRVQAEALVARLQAAGIDAAALPLIDIAPPADTQAVGHAWEQLGDCALAMFVSANAVGQFFALRPAHAAWPPQTLAGATGPGTAAALHAAGVPPACIVQPEAEPFDSEGLWQRLCGRSWAGRRVLVVRGEDGRDWLAEQLRAGGARVDFVAAYRRCAPLPDAAGRALLAAALAQPLAHAWLFSSSEAVAHLRALAPGADWSPALALATHPRIEAAAQAIGFGRVEAAPVPLDALVARLASLQSTAP
jgi:uroporphyrinogen-III synthase